MPAETKPARRNLTRFAWLSIAAAVITIGMKLLAYWLTNSVGLLSDAIESLVNLASAIVALIALTIAAKPADEEFTFGYYKAEYFSSGFEGGMILLAAVTIAATAIRRLFDPQPIEQVGLGLAVSIGASLINLGVSLVLGRAARQYNSITLEADAKHLMTDVVTTGGVIIGVALVAITGWQWLDPVIALLVAANIVFTGFRLVRRSALGLMDVALPAGDIQTITTTLNRYEAQGVVFHGVRTRTAAARSFMSMHVLVPGQWTVQRGHALADQIERDICAKLPAVVIVTHVEPLNDPISMEDSAIEQE